MCSLAPSSVSTTTLHDLEDHADVALLVEWVFVDPQIEPRQLIDVLESAFLRYTGYCAAHFQPPECIVRIDRQDRHRRPARHVAVFLTAVFRVDQDVRPVEVAPDGLYLRRPFVHERRQ